MPPSPIRSGRSTGTARTIACRCGAIACWPESSSSRAVQIRRISDLGQILRRPRRRAALGVDQPVGERRDLGQRRRVAGVRQHDAAPDQPGQRPELRQPHRRQRPGAGEVALVGGERPPEAVGAAAVEPLGQECRVHRPALGAARRRARPPSPGRRRCRSAGSSPAPSPAPARAPAGCRAPRGRRARGRPAARPRAAGRGSARSRSSRLPTATACPSARQLPATSASPRSASPSSIGSGIASATLGPAAEPGAVRPDPVPPGARRPGDPLAQGPQRQSGSGCHVRVGP